jgi:hypothetical protein
VGHLEIAQPGRRSQHCEVWFSTPMSVKQAERNYKRKGLKKRKYLDAVSVLS